MKRSKRIGRAAVRSLKRVRYGAISTGNVLAQMLRHPGVTDDGFVNVTLNSIRKPASNSIAATGGVAVAGVYLDASGLIRTASELGVGALLPEG